MFPAISIGGFAIPTLPLVYLLGTYAALGTVEFAARRLRIDHIAVYAVATAALLTGIIGARLVFVGRYWSEFSGNPLSIVWPLTSGYSLTGGILFAVGALLVETRRRNLSLPDCADALAAGVAIAFFVIPLADFLGGPGLGTATSLPWGITVVDVPRHPVQVYEMMAAILALVVWYRVRSTRAYSGQLALLVTAVLSGGYVLSEAFRLNAALLSSGIRQNQLIALILLLFALFLLARNAPQAAEGAPV